MTSAKVSVLLLEDNPHEERLIWELLHAANKYPRDYPWFEIECTGQLREGLARLAADEIDVVLFNLRLMDSDQWATFTALQAYATQVPLIMLTGYDEEEWGLRAVQQGAQDYLPKGELTGRLLARALLYAIERHRLKTELRQHRDQLEEQVAVRTAELTEREEKLRVNLTKYRTLLDFFPVGVTISDAEGHIVESNRAAERLLGISRTEQKDRHIAGAEWRIIRSDGTPMPAAEYAGVRALEEQRLVANVEMGIVKEDNQITWLNVTAAPIPLDDYGVAITYGDITARKQAEEELRESEAWHRQLLESITDGCWVLDAEWRYTLVNEQGARLVHMSPAQLLGHKLTTLFPNVVETPFFAAYERAINERTVESVTAAFTLPEAGERIYEIRVYPISKGILCIGNDVTARQQAEEALRAREKLFQTLFDNVKDGIFVHPILPDNQPGPFIQVNAAACALLGYSPAEFRRMTPWELDDPATSSDYILQAMQQLRDRGTARFEAYQVAKDGRKVLVELHAHVCEIHGAPHIIAVGRDITARKRAESTTQARLRLAQAAASHTPKALMQLTLDEIEALTNSEISFYHLLLPDQQTVVHQAWSTHTLAQCTAATPGRRDLVSAGGVWAECLTTRAPVVHNDYAPLPQRRGLPAGHVPVTRAMVVPVMRNERVVAILGVGNKPTAYQPADVKLLALLADFSWEIIERRRAKEELAHYAAELQRSNEDLQQFATIVSHDLQTPLRMVTSFLGLLEKQYRASLVAEAQEYIDFAATNARQMSILIHNLLQYSRIAGRGQEPTPVDTAALLAEVLRTLQFQISDCGAEITHDSLPLVHADATQTQQLFQNLLGNALKFRRPNVPPRIHLAVDRQGDKWQFAVRDNGIGIAPEYHEHIFTIFQRGAQAHNDEYEGTGVGLAICQKIVERHGGRIWVESAEGQGTTFYFTLPAVPEEPKQTAEGCV